MKDFSSSNLKRKIVVQETEAETLPPESDPPIMPVCEQISSFDINNPQPSKAPLQTQSEIQYMMSSMEELRLRNPDHFAIVILNSKKILDLVQQNAIEKKEDIKLLDELFKEVEDIDIEYLYWCSNKSIKIAVLQHKNIHLIHYFIIKKGYRLTNKSIYSNFINDYLISLRDYDFINGSDQQTYMYTIILKMLIDEGKCDLNDNENNDLKNTPLHYAVAFRQLQFVIVLTKYKILDINKRNVHGSTALDFAVENLWWKKQEIVDEKICEILIQNGGEVNLNKKQFDILFTVEEVENNDNDEDNNTPNTTNKEINN